MNKPQDLITDIKDYEETLSSVISRIILVGTVSIFFGIYFYFVSSYWINLPLEYQGMYQTIIFTFVVGFIWWYSKGKLQFYIVTNSIVEEQISKIEIVLIFIFLSGILINVLTMPFPPIFNIHAFNMLDLGKYFIENCKLPFFDSKLMVSISVQSNLYPQQSIFAYFLALFDIKPIETYPYLLFSNFMSIIFYFLAMLPAIMIFRNNYRRALVFIIIPFAIPPIYEVFIKYPSSDLFVIFCSTSILASANHYLKNGDPRLLLFFLSFSLVLRLYFALVCIIFTALFILYLWNRNYWFFKKTTKEFLAFKRGWVYIIFCLIVSTSWFLTTYKEYKVLLPGFTSIELLGNNSTNLTEKLNSDYFSALINSNVKESNSFEELKNSIVTNDIYYKTYKNKKLLTGWTKIPNIIFSTPIFLLLFFSIIIELIRRKKKIFFTDEVNALSLIWGFSIILSWFIMNKSDYPIVKIFLMGVPSVSLILAHNQLKWQWSNKLINSNLLIICFCVFSFYFHNIAVPFISFSNNVQESKSINERSFKQQYGNKIDFIEFVKENKINDKNILWVVRAEHGGIISFFVDNRHFWERNWYDSPRFHSIHTAPTDEELKKNLLKENIQYIVSTDNESLKRFFIDPFKNNLGYNEILLELLEQNESNFLKPVFIEEFNRGLEFRVFKII